MKCALSGILETYKQLNLFTSRALETGNLKTVWTLPRKHTIANVNLGICESFEAYP